MQTRASDPFISSITHVGLLLMSMLVGCSFLAANISGRYIKCYPGPNLPRQQVAVVAFADLADDEDPAPNSFRVNETVTKLANAIELMPGQYDITMFWGGMERTVRVVLRPGGLYVAGGKRERATAFVIDKFITDSAWTPAIDDISEEHSQRSQRIEAYVSEKPHMGTCD